MPYTGLKVDDTVHDTSKSSHAIPAYPEFNSSTVYNDAYYQERREECDRLMGASIDYHQGDGSGSSPAVDISDAVVSGPNSLSVGNEYLYSLTGTYDDNYVRDYKVVWAVPSNETAIWEYRSDVTDILIVKASGKSSGTGTITCTLTERQNTSNIQSFTKTVNVF